MLQQLNPLPENTSIVTPSQFNFSGKDIDFYRNLNMQELNQMGIDVTFDQLTRTNNLLTPEAEAFLYNTYPNLPRQPLDGWIEVPGSLKPGTDVLPIMIPDGKGGWRKRNVWIDEEYIP